jgi:hypothetical protein
LAMVSASLHASSKCLPVKKCSDNVEAIWDTGLSRGPWLYAPARQWVPGNGCGCHNCFFWTPVFSWIPVKIRITSIVVVLLLKNNKF